MAPPKANTSIVRRLVIGLISVSALTTGLMVLWALRGSGDKAYSKLTPQDYEIFDLMSSTRKDFGSGATLYSYLNLNEHASHSEINKKYREMSLESHPDKSDAADAEAKFAHLGKVVKILRDKKARKRYDHWRKDGIPWWTGRQYFFRHSESLSLPATLVLLALLLGAGQYAVLYIMYIKDKTALFNMRKRVGLIDSEGKLKAAKKAQKYSASSVLGNGDEPFSLSVVFGTPSEWLKREVDAKGLEEVIVEKPSVRDLFVVKTPQRLYHKFTSKPVKEKGAEVIEESQKIKESVAKAIKSQ